MPFLNMNSSKLNLLLNTVNTYLRLNSDVKQTILKKYFKENFTLFWNTTSSNTRYFHSSLKAAQVQKDGVTVLPSPQEVSFNI